MQVPNGLSPVHARVAHTPVPRLGDPLIARHRPGEREDAPEQRGILGGVEGADVRPGDDQQVDRRLGRDVVKGERMSILMHFFRRNLAAQNAREDIAIIIGAKAIDGHGFASLEKTCPHHAMRRQDWKPVQPIPSQAAATSSAPLGSGAARLPIQARMSPATVAPPKSRNSM